MDWIARQQRFERYRQALKAPTAITCGNEKDGIQRAKQLVGGYDIELWD